ncbi:hypothetical protein SAMN06295912_11923 [Sphingomonas laterariae]|uniref:Uncharacterized protein n=1 Tax=Edaphosphingomonas laterariae TaxID=861865 RepID=A0A239HTE6_9SPHN|nr:hypothetical protein [Sphingomonas laterariae]SNS84599.1 hypothetical protein SAMN06295912_11923 [Sphingomonas laterariae]
MSLAVVERLIDAARGLTRALDLHDVAAIEAATADFRDATAAVQATGGWRETPELKARIAEAMAEADAARLRSAYYGDATRRRLEGLAALGANIPAPIAYGRRKA